jgi:hypothetical protein
MFASASSLTKDKEVKEANEKDRFRPEARQKTKTTSNPTDSICIPTHRPTLCGCRATTRTMTSQIVDLAEAQ